MAEHWQTLIAVDSEQSAADCYRANFPGVDVRHASVADVLDSLPPCDLVEGGPPCQGFSLAGAGLGEADPRNGIPDFTDAVARVKPRAFLMENVKGLLSEKHWPYFSRVFRALGDAGYVVQYRLLDAVNFGVPQFRERVWLWGIRSDLYRDGIRHAWPVPTHAWPPPEPCMFGASLLPGVTVGQALEIDGFFRMCRGAGMCDRHGDRRDIPTVEPAPTISAGSKGSGPRYDFHCYDHGVADPAAPSPTIKAGGNIDAGGKQGGGCPPVLRVIGGGYNPPAGRSDLRTVRDITDEPSTTISVAGGNALPELRAWGGSEPWRLDRPSMTVLATEEKGAQNAPYFDPARSPARASDGYYRATGIRRLTYRECARLQSMPDDYVWPDGITKTAAYRVVGNGQASEFARRMGEAMRAVDPELRTAVSLFCGGGLGDLGFAGRSWRYEPTTAGKEGAA